MNRVTTSLGVRRHSSEWASTAARVKVTAVNDRSGRRMRDLLCRMPSIPGPNYAVRTAAARRRACVLQPIATNMSRHEGDFNMNDIAALTARIEKLEHELAVEQDINQIRRVQYTYGYFIDKSQYNEVVDLFAESGEVWFLGGIYRGKAGVRRLYIERFQTQFTQGHNGPRYGWLLDHPQLQMVIDVAPDRRTAQARGRSMMQAGLHHTAEGNPRAWWEGGIYENDYVRENGIWKIKALRYFPFWHGSFAEGWQKTPIDFIPMAKTRYPQDPLGPDDLINPPPRLWPATDTVPFHYPHPVTGRPIVLDNSRAREGFKDG